jgi:multiple sugar transport system ATP-binding protein
MLDIRKRSFDNPGVARIVIEHLTKSFRGLAGKRVRAVEDINLEVRDKELLVLVGPSGCGKTTSLRLIAGLETPDSGSIAMDGAVVNRVPAKERDVAMVFQNHALYPHLSAYENIAFGLKVRHRPRAEIRQRVQEAAAMLSLVPFLERKPDELSGGERQRVALARALVRRPKAFLFDEPLSNLDAQLRAQMRFELSRLHRQLGATILYVTHEQQEAMALGERIAVMNQGRLQQVASPRELYQKPANLFVASFIGSPRMNFFSGKFASVAGQPVFHFDSVKSLEPVSVPVTDEQARRLVPRAGRPLVLGLRPEHILEAQAAGATQGFKIEAAVELVEFLGAEAHVHLSAGSQAFQAKARASTSVQPNHRIPIYLEMSHAHFFDPETGEALR